MLSALPSRVKAAAVWGLALAVLALVPQSTVHAQGSGSFGPPGVTAAVLGAYYDTSATIQVDPGTISQTIQISDRRRLNVNMFVKVDNEEMWITALSGDVNPVWNPSNPDIMTVNRAQNGTVAAAHNVGASVKAKVARVSITVSNLTTDVLDCDQDEESYSGSDLAQDINNTVTLVHITTVPQAVLTAGTHIRIDSEEMTINSLITYPSGPDPRMNVTRGVNGTTAAPHYAGTRIYKENASPTPRQQCGLGAYRIDLHYDPAKATYISLVNESFLGSTGRSVYDATGTCFTPDTSTPGVVTMQCNTLGSSLGPREGASGLVATALFQPLVIGRPISSLTMGDSSHSFLMDIFGNVLSGVSLTSGGLQSMTCPDANGDGVVNILDVQQIAKNFGDTGKNSGATLAAPVDASQTTIQISGLGTLAANDVIAVDFEQMRVNSLSAGPPATMVVQRAVNQTPAKTHQAGTIIYRAFDLQPIGDGVAGYTEPRDTNPKVYGGSPDLSVNILDAMPAAWAGLVLSTKCP